MAALVAGAASGASASIRNVPSTYGTIQAAITAAASGDTVLVAPGTYSASGDYNLDATGKSITITSSGGAASTILDYTGASSGNQKHVITFQNAASSGSVFSGFTVKNGYFDNGMITVVDCNVTISDCVFTGNTAGAFGGAIFLNTNGSTMSETITRCEFINNTAGDLSTNSGFGGAIEAQQAGSGSMTASITNCAFISNDASYDGGAVDIDSASGTSPALTVTNCSFSKDNANGFVAPNVVGIIPSPDSTHKQGAIDKFGGVMTLENCVLYGDTAPVEISTLDPGATATFSDIQGGFSGTGNFNSDPLYVNPSSNLEPTAGSPIINVGTSAGAPSLDADDVTRDAHPDVGAYEYALSATANAINTNALTSFSGTVATFDDTSTDDTGVGFFSANINWGDSTASAGTVTQPGGVGTHFVVTGSHIYSTAGSFTTSVSISAATDFPDVTASASNTANVGPAPATHFSVTASSPQTSGVAFNVTVQALDAGNNSTTNYPGTVTFTSTDGAAILPSNGTLTNGVGTFSVTLNTPGAQTVTAKDTVAASIAGTTSSISVSQPPATHFAVSASSPQTAGVGFSFTVTALDASNNPTSNYSGTVDFSSSDGGATLPAPATLSSGQGTFNATLTTAGSQSLTAQDSGTPSITGTQSGILVNAAAATHIVIGIPNPVTSYNTYSLSFTAEDQFGNTDTSYGGTLQLSSSDPGFVNLGNVTLAAGVGSENFALKTAGSQSVTATDISFPGIHGTVTTTVLPGPTDHFVVSAPSSAIPGQAVSVTVTAVDLWGNLTTSYGGIVHFTSSDGAAVLPADSTLTVGTGTFSVTFNSLGSQTITASDAANSLLNSSGPVNVAYLATTTTVATSVNPATLGYGGTLTATVSALALGRGAPTGSVQFQADGINIGSPVTIDESGNATFPISSLPVGGHWVTAVYSGDSLYATSASTQFKQYLFDTTTLALTSSVNPCYVGSTVTFTATVNPSNGGASGTPTGKVQFQIGGRNVGSPVAVNGAGVANYITSALPPGPVTVYALYGGDAKHRGSSSAPLRQLVGRQPSATVITLSAGANPTAHGQSVTLIATVTSGSGTPTGKVQFRIGGIAYGAPISLVNGVATWTTKQFSVGSDSVTAFYGGDAQFVSSTSSPYILVVN